MKIKTSGLSKNESSKKLVRFLEDKEVHKKDFAQMIGVTLSYVYSLIDNAVPFSTRSTTLERVAVVMSVEPEEFIEYKPSEEPKIIDSGIKFLQHHQKELGMTNVEFLKKFPRNKRVDIVDLWRGALPLPLDWNYLMNICDVLKISAEDIYPYWQSRMQQHLMAGGLDVLSNNQLVEAMFDAARKQLKA